MSSKARKLMIENEALNARFLHLTIYKSEEDEGRECDLRKLADILQISMKEIAEELEDNKGVATIKGFTIYQTKTG